MSWTYSGDPSLSSKDAIRFLVGDTNEDEPLATNEEIEWALSQNSNIYAAASVIADGISTYFTRCADAEEIGPIKTSFNNRVKFYTTRSAQLLAKAGTKSSLAVYGGGIDIADKVQVASDSTLTGSNFAIGMNDFISPVTGQ